jgi:hypothetical protein
MIDIFLINKIKSNDGAVKGTVNVVSLLYLDYIYPCLYSKVHLGRVMDINLVNKNYTSLMMSSMIGVDGCW